MKIKQMAICRLIGSKEYSNLRGIILFNQNEKNVLVLFQSVILGLAGNAGTQSLAVTIRKISQSEFDTKRKTIKHLLIELKTGIFLGLILGILALGFVSFILFVRNDRDCLKIGIIVGLVVAVVTWVLEAIPIYLLAKKLGREHAWLAWVPIFGAEFRLWVLSDIACEKPFTVYKEKYTIKNRANSFWLYVAIKYFGAAVISAVVGVVSAIIPLIGSVSAVLMLLPTVACAIIEYVYLRDVLDIFKENNEANKKTSFFITLLDSFVTLGFARIFYLFTLLKCSPLPSNVEIVIEEATK